MKKYIGVMIAGSGLFLVDQISKWYALRACANGPIILSKYVACDLCFNAGSCWSLLSGTTSIQQSFLFVAIFGLSVAIVFQLIQKKTTGQALWPEILILAGAAGNLYDRVMYGAVVDFIALSYGELHWPVFNCADSFVVIGVGALFIQLFMNRSTQA